MYLVNVWNMEKGAKELAFLYLGLEGVSVVDTCLTRANLCLACDGKSW